MLFEIASQLIDANPKSVHHNYQGREDIVYIDEKLTKLLVDHVLLSIDDSSSLRDTIKLVVREVFELYESDMVFLKNDAIFIKLFDDAKVVKIEPQEQDSIKNRYNGIDVAELEFFYDNFFIKDSDGFFQSVAKEFVGRYIIEKKITNMVYEKSVFPSVQMIISEFLMSRFDHSAEFMKGFAGFVFRKHFNEVFEHMADNILYEIGVSNRFVIEFLKYYALNAVVVDGKKYRVPAIEASGGMRWNVASMISVVKVYIKTQNSLSGVKSKKDRLQNSIALLMVDSMPPLEYNNAIRATINNILQDYLDVSAELGEYQKELLAAKDEQKSKVLRSRIVVLQEELRDLDEERNMFEDKFVGKAGIQKYNGFKKEMDGLKRLEKKEEQIIAQNRAAFVAMRHSLAKALMSKKQLF